MGAFLQMLGISGRTLAIAGIFLLAVLLSVCIHLMRRRKVAREQEQHAVQRMREEALNRALANPMGKTGAESFEKQRRPFQVEYSKGEESQKEKGQSRMFQITEVTELSQKKYMFRCEEQVSIGNQFGTIMILPETAEAGQAYCQVFFYEGANYVRSTGQTEVLLKRRGKQAIVNQAGIRLQSRDTFTVGNTAFQITFLQ